MVTASQGEEPIRCNNLCPIQFCQYRICNFLYLIFPGAVDKHRATRHCRDASSTKNLSDRGEAAEY